MRIVTGSVKGLKLKSPKGFSTRPTSDRVKESVFNILNGMINFSEVDNVLDIFAGTGSLGIEALSRGASSAVFIDFATTEIIAENIKRGVNSPYDYCATLVDAEGNPISDVEITFTIDGKTYKAKTNAKGVASVNVSLNKKGTYNFVAKFAGDSTYTAINKTAKLTIK